MLRRDWCDCLCWTPRDSAGRRANATQRDKRAAIKKQLATLQAKHKEGDATTGRKIETLQSELVRRSSPARLTLQSVLEQDDRAAEDSVLALKRRKLQEVYGREFEGLRRLGEQLALIAGHGQLLVSTLESPLQAGVPYSGAEKTAAIAKAAEDAVHGWTPASARIPLPQQPTSLGRADTVSFGTSHKAKLDHLDAHESTSPAMSSSAHHDSANSFSNLNMAPVPVSKLPSPEPLGAASPPALRPVDGTTVDAGPAHVPLAGPTPTFAEVGTPISGTHGPTSGQLRPRPPLDSIPSNSNLSTTATLGDSAPDDSVSSSRSAKEAARAAKEAEARRETEARFSRLGGGGDEAGPSDGYTAPPAYH